MKGWSSREDRADPTPHDQGALQDVTFMDVAAGHYLSAASQTALAHTSSSLTCCARAFRVYTLMMMKRVFSIKQKEQP